MPPPVRASRSKSIPSRRTNADMLKLNRTRSVSATKSTAKQSVSRKPTQPPKIHTLTGELDVLVSNSGVRQTNKQNIFGGSLYSRALLRGDDEDTKIQNESLRYFEGTRRLFFRKCKTFPPELKSFNPKNKRGIWNEFNRVVYYTGQKEGHTCRNCLYSGFVHEVVDYSGQTVIIAKGQQSLFGMSSKMEIFMDGGKLLGTMQQRACLSSTYEIKDSSGRLVYKIQAPCFAPIAPFVFWCCREHFELCMDDGVTEIGKISKTWGNSVSVPEFSRCLGIEMDRVDDVRVKALLLGCFFLIEFQYFKRGGNGPIFFILMILTFFIIWSGLIACKCMFIEYDNELCPSWLPFPFEDKIDKI